MRALFRLLYILAAVACAHPAYAERLWLVVAASDPTPAGIAAKVKHAGGQEGIIFRTTDCGDSGNIYGWAARVEGSKRAAEAAVQEVRKMTAKDAFVKRCEVKRGSLLAYRIPAVDPSIAEVPETAVNWEDEDRVSTVKTLPDGRAVALVRYFEAADDDPLEGRRERVLLIDKSGTQRRLTEHCLSASKFRVKEGRIAFQCVTEQAGDHLLHSVLLFDEEGGRLKEFRRCRNPRLAAGGYFYCQAESVEADGSLRLRSVRQRIWR